MMQKRPTEACNARRSFLHTEDDYYMTVGVCRVGERGKIRPGKNRSDPKKLERRRTFLSKKACEIDRRRQ